MLTNRCVAASFAFATWITAMKLTSAGVFHAKLLRVLLVGQLYVLERRNMYRPQYAEKARKGSLDWDGISYFVGDTWNFVECGVSSSGVIVEKVSTGRHESSSGQWNFQGCHCTLLQPLTLIR